MKRPFITLDGGEGVGKTTQRLLLKERLPLAYPEVDFVFTREPGGSALAESIRNAIFSHEAREASGKTLFGLFTAARHDHLERVIVPALEEGSCVVSDRFAAATLAYQVTALPNPASITAFEVHMSELLEKPDLTLLLDMDATRAMDRVRLRTGEVTHFDERPLEFHESLRKGYELYADMNRATTRTINADQELELVHKDIMEAIEEVVGQRLR